MPFLDSISLVDLVADYERADGHEPAGGYARLVPEYDRFADLRHWPHTHVNVSYDWTATASATAVLPPRQRKDSSSGTGTVVGS